MEAIDDRSVTGVLAPTTAIRAGFPFSFELRLRYALEGTALVFSAELANRGDEPFPYAFGLHPYLRAPLGGASGRSNCKVRLPAGSEEFARAIPGAQFRLIDACHMMPAQAPDLLLPLIDDFLAHHAAPAA